MNNVFGQKNLFLKDNDVGCYSVYKNSEVYEMSSFTLICKCVGAHTSFDHDVTEIEKTAVIQKAQTFFLTIILFMMLILFW